MAEIRDTAIIDALRRQMAIAAAKQVVAAGNLANVKGDQGELVAMRRDGNNVQIDRDLLTMSTAAGEFARAQTALAARFRMVRYALHEGR